MGPETLTETSMIHITVECLSHNLAATVLALADPDIQLSAEYGRRLNLYWHPSGGQLRVQWISLGNRILSVQAKCAALQYEVDIRPSLKPDPVDVFAATVGSTFLIDPRLNLFQGAVTWAS